jgi:hypothetical protein
MGARISAEEHQKIEQMLRDIGATKG